uniref:Uncharacterized protein n=1 Tax=Xenopus tropicalis TaxID=8364 RepID=A0A6I8SHT1_XENTR
MFNQNIVSPGFTKDGFTISSTGVDIIVGIEAIKARIIFSDTLFMLTLPMSMFYNNTEGLCGTFTNNRSDDCLFQNGTYASDCSQVASSWNVNNVTDTLCSLNPALLPTEETPTISTCIATNLCDIIISTVFDPCHENVPPDTYFQMCMNTACQTNNENNLCSILELYANQCQLQGKCVDWRHSTDNKCAYKCPLEMDYQACGPSEQPTCYSKLPVTNNKFFTEGCFCKAGTMLFNYYSNICVPTCPCIGPDGMPKMPGSSWTTGCHDCVCEMNSVTVECKPVLCTPPVIPSCTRPGYTLVEVKDPQQPCCPKSECQCNRSLCQNTTTACPLGFQLTVPDAKGECCVINECKPMNVCVENGTIYLPNQVIPSLLPDVCAECTCTSDTDPVSMINAVACLSKECVMMCQEGFNYTVQEGQCCGTCVQVACIMTVENETILIQPGETWHMPGNNCSSYSCQTTEGHIVLTNVHTPCTVLSQSDCGTGYRYTIEAGDCCGKCEMLTCIVTLDNNSTHVLQPGDVWSPADNPCVTHECTHNFNTVSLDSKVKLCVINCGQGYKYKEITGECCGECIKVACSLDMDNMTKILQPGDTFIPPNNACIKYVCSQAYELVAEKTSCPEFNAADCKEGTINMTADGCCMTCEMEAVQKNCSLYSMSTEIQSGGCISAVPVDLTYCAGTCSSSFMYSLVTNMMETTCTCCIALRSAIKEINLMCPDGSSISSSYTYVEECGCSVPSCQDIINNGENSQAPPPPP